MVRIDVLTGLLGCLFGFCVPGLFGSLPDHSFTANNNQQAYKTYTRPRPSKNNIHVENI